MIKKFIAWFLTPTSRDQLEGSFSSCSPAVKLVAIMTLIIVLSPLIRVFA